MVDVALSVTVSRELLGLAPLELANSAVYYVAPQFLGAVVQWDRQQVSSRYLDGDVTVSRRRQNVVERIAVEVKGPDLPAVQLAIKDLIDAFCQDRYTLTVVAGGATRAYACETADYQDLSWTTPRLVAAQGQVLLNVPRSPVALAGGY